MDVGATQENKTGDQDLMEVESSNPSDSGNNDLRSLSLELGLDDLWSTLSECLIELGETPDTHAVLVLQPAVEAFFLVHASASVPDKKTKPSTTSESREAQLAHLQHEIAPLSPLPASLDDGSGTPRNEKDQSSQEASVECDSIKFLRFAGMDKFCNIYSCLTYLMNILFFRNSSFCFKSNFEAINSSLS